MNSTLTFLLCLLAAIASTSESSSSHPSNLRLSRQLESCGARICSESIFDLSSSGFNVKVRDYWFDFAQQRDDGTYDTGDCEYLCCAASEDLCCKEYPVDYMVAFYIEVVGLGVMVIGMVYYCVRLMRGGEETKETE